MAFCLTALVVSACGGGEDPSTSTGQSGTGGSVATGTGGSGGRDLEGALAVCVLNKGAAQDPCATPNVLDYGVVPAGTKEMRLFRIDNATNQDAVFQAVKVNSAGFSVVTVRYDDDPKDPGGLVRVPQVLPATRPPGTALYFEVTYLSTGVAGSLSAAVVHVDAGPVGAKTSDIAVPIAGATQGCPTGKGACDADPLNGCETDLGTDALNCGACQQPCDLPNSIPACQGGQCGVGSCKSPFADCNQIASDGCEQNLLTSVTACGACDVDCARPHALPVCKAGICAIQGCADGFADCNGVPDDGCEQDIAGSITHCGGCNLGCNLTHADETCVAGSCQVNSCDPGFFDCDSQAQTGCEVDGRNDNANCGACKKACNLAHSSSSCAQSACQVDSCAAGYENCNGDPLDGCEAALAVDAQHCGSCANDCGAVYPHSVVGCGAGGVCSFSGCLPNYYDLDLSSADGCEYACTFVSAADLPDDAFTDENCDGIDGDASKAIFVSTTGLDTNPGTKQSPMLTVNAAVARGVSTGKAQVYISQGIYDGRVTLANGVSLYGGYSEADGWARSAAFVTTIRSGTVANGHVSAIEGASITAATTVDRLTIQTLDTNVIGASSYAMQCVGCSAVTLKNSTLEAGAAGPGAPGGPGNIGVSGGPGSSGGAGDCDADVAGGTGGPGGTSPCGRTGGSGGKGGSFGANNGVSGSSGIGGTSGGPGGLGGAVGGAGTKGSNGATGAPGVDGFGAGGGMVLSGFWQGVAGLSGALGGNGNGGGGGGGGGGQGCSGCDEGPGNGGGGGGAGGCGGTGASGGAAGGGSFGLFLVSSSGFVMTNNNIASGPGGMGGPGGVGGPGGPGGAGALGGQICTSEVGPGGPGGNGGTGGRGGHGGGGAGGASFAVYRSVTGVVTTGNNLVGGPGGAGGTSLGSSGATGQSGMVF